MRQPVDDTDTRTRGRQRPSRKLIDVAAPAVILLLTVTAPAFIVDDAAFFNYLHNVAEPHAFYYYNGYVQPLSAAISYLLSPLPLAWQPVLYRLPSLAAALLLYRESARFLALRGNGDDAKALALSIVVLLRIIDVFMWANLAFTMWLLLLIATLIAIRAAISGAAFSRFDVALVAFAMLAYPLGLVLLLPLGLHALRAGNRVTRAQTVSLAIVMTMAQLWMLSGATQPLWNDDIAGAPRVFIAQFGGRKLHNLVMVASLGTLMAAVWWARRAAAAVRADLIVTASLCGIAWATAVAYLLSNRFVRYSGGFETRFVVPAAFCGLIAIGWMVLADRVVERRARWVGAVAGAAGMFLIAHLYGTLRGPLELALMKYQFVAVASRARAACPPHDVYVFEDEESSPLLFCRPLVLEPGDDLILRNFVPSVGGIEPDGAATARPFVLNPKPFP